ncbi:hypothetical protein AVEN_43448-1 [Araneus ventricosus]|uniref:Uncharacterized protein n=1 Tax=Araneus ventricosus TaxID=182803 RepID=A0A4Y2JKL3_ARAVE|nr:hypothetical protein AVEN_43448-1 [Araneus ventricosus]
MPKRKRGVTRDDARRQQAIMKRERRVAETHEERNGLFPTMHNGGRREETEEQRNSRLAVMAQRGQRRRAEETDENHHQIQTFYAARTVHYPIVEEHNFGEMDNLCLKCGGLYFRDEKNTRGIYTHCCHNRNIIEQASVYPVEMKGLMDGSDELSVHFKNNIRSYQCFNGCTDCTVYRERSVLLQNSWPNLSQDLSSSPS